MKNKFKIDTRKISSSRQYEHILSQMFMFNWTVTALRVDFITLKVDLIKLKWNTII